MGKTRKYKNRRYKTKKLLRGGGPKRPPKGVPSGEAPHIRTRTLENGSKVGTVKSSSPITFTHSKSIYIYTDVDGKHYVKNPTTKKLFTNPNLQQFISSKISRQVANSKGSLYENPEQFRFGAAKAANASKAGNELNKANSKKAIAQNAAESRAQTRKAAREAARTNAFAAAFTKARSNARRQEILNTAVNAFRMGIIPKVPQSSVIKMNHPKGESSTNGNPAKPAKFWKKAQQVLGLLKLSKKKEKNVNAHNTNTATAILFG